MIKLEQLFGYQFSVFCFRNLVYRSSVYQTGKQRTGKLGSDNRQLKTDNRALSEDIVYKGENFIK
jgi:hypothetical protein